MGLGLELTLELTLILELDCSSHISVVSGVSYRTSGRPGAVLSLDIVLMSTNVNFIESCPRDCLTFFVLHRTKCKPMHFEQGYG